MKYAVSSRPVFVRNNFGQFAREMDAAAHQTAADMVDEGIRVARSLVPKRTMRLHDSIGPIEVGGKVARWGAFTDYAMAQEKGTPRHGIPGNVRFYWKREGRWWTPGDNVIDHPGNPGRHFMRSSYEVVTHRAMSIIRQNYNRV